MSSEKVEIIAPASLANLGSGFDVFGIALKEPYDVIGAKRVSEPGVMIVEVTGVGANRVTLDPKHNTASVAAFEVLRKARADFGLELSIRKGRLWVRGQFHDFLKSSESFSMVHCTGMKIKSGFFSSRLSMCP